MGLERFRKHPYRNRRLKDYCSRMSRDYLGDIFDDHVANVLRAQGIPIYESPRSVYKVEKLYTALAKYEPGRIGPPVKDQHLTHGIKLAHTCFARPSDVPELDVLAFTASTVASITTNKQASAGLTALGVTKAEAMTRALERGLQVLAGEKVPEPCLAFKRTQANDKTRLVWGYPYAMTAIEGLIARPLIDYFLNANTPMAFGTRSFALGTKLRVASYHRRYAYSIDMSSYDASISAFLIHQAFKVLRTWFNQDQVEPVSGRSVRYIFDQIERYFIHTPIVMPDGNLYLGKQHGVPSGSYFTQMIDSIVNVIIAGTISHRFSLHVSKREIFVLGDDLLMWSDREMSLEKISSFASSYFGVEFNYKKSSRFLYNEPIHYLGRWWDKGVPTIDTKEIIEHMVSPERFRKYSKDDQEAKYQVAMVITSYASVYEDGWSIAKKCYGSDLWNRQGSQSVDVPVYYHQGRTRQLNPNYLSGLERYLRLYVRSQSHGDIPVTAFQFWL